MTGSELFLSLLGAAIAVFYGRRAVLGMLVKSYSPAEVARKLDGEGKVLLLDVRTKGERQARSIKGSLHIPLHELARRADELEKHRDKEIVCYCQTGSRSLSAASKLRKRGYTVANMKGGIAEWNFQNLG